MLVDCSYALVPGDIVKKNLLGVARIPATEIDEKTLKVKQSLA
jgi:hypothetical protein